MGLKQFGLAAFGFFHHLSFASIVMAKGMKAAPVKAMSKGAIADALAASAELKKSVVTKLLGTLAEVGQAEVKKNGVFTIPGLARVKTRRKPATSCQEDDVRPRSRRQSKACQDCRQGIPSGCAQERNLTLESAKQG